MVKIFGRNEMAAERRRHRISEKFDWPCVCRDAWVAAFSARLITEKAGQGTTATNVRALAISPVDHIFAGTFERGGV